MYVVPCNCVIIGTSPEPNPKPNPNAYNIKHM